MHLMYTTQQAGTGCAALTAPGASRALGVSVLTAVVLAVVFFVVSAGVARAHPEKPFSAVTLFTQLPPSIFDNTDLPMTEAEKEELLDKGYTRNWAIAYHDDDLLFLTPMRGDFADVTVQVFRSPQGGGVVALGARTSDACAVELWQFDTHEGLVPLALPADPEVADVLSAYVSLADDVRPTYRFCLRGLQLEAQPVFWNDQGVVNIPVLNRVLYRWNGSGFSKYVVDATLPADLAAPVQNGNGQHMQQFFMHPDARSLHK